jgi:hypothetical protein
MSDSLIGWMAWFWEYRYHGSGDFVYTFEELITQAIVLFFQGTYGMFSFYKRAFFQRDYPNSNIPVGIMHFQSGGLGRDDAYQYVVSRTHSLHLHSFCTLLWKYCGGLCGEQSADRTAGLVDCQNSESDV